MRRSNRAGGHARRAGARARRQSLALLGAACAVPLGYVALGSPTLNGAAAAIVVSLTLLMVSASRLRQAQRWRVGRRSERRVARRLTRLQRRGWTIAHDLDRGRGNVDHVAIGPRAVFAIETKTTRRGPGELAQALANARWVSRRLGVPVVPVLCITQRRQRPRIVAGVLCVDERRLPRTLRRRERGEPLDIATLNSRLQS